MHRVCRSLLAAALACGLLSCTSTSSGAKSDGPPSVSEVRALLARHTQAVVGHSSAAFLADVDTAAQAAGFRARQVAEIAALAAVPLASWNYAIDAQVNDTAATGVASTRYGTPALIVRIALTYRLRDLDVAASGHTLWWTFVRRSGRTVLSGDDDLAGSGGASWRGIWDFGRIDVARGVSTLILGHPDAATSLPAIAKAVDAAIPTVTDVVGRDWARTVAVLVPSTAAEFQTLSGGAGSTDISAVTVFDDPGVSRSARVVVRPDVLGTLTPLGLQIVLRHEITHVAAALTTSPITPRWLIEGFADYVGNRDSGQPVPEAAGELAKAVRAGSLPTTLPSDSAFGGSGAALQQVYEQSWLACQFLASRIGPSGLTDFYAAVGRSTAPNETAFAVVLKARLGMSLPQFIAGWRAYLLAELR